MTATRALCHHAGTRFVARRTRCSSAYRTASRRSRSSPCGLHPAQPELARPGLITPAFPTPAPRSAYHPVPSEPPQRPRVRSAHTPDPGSRGCSSRSPPPRWLQTTPIYCLIVPEVRTPNSAEIKAVGRTILPLDVLGENLFSCLFQLLEPCSLRCLTDGPPSTFKASGEQGKNVAAGGRPVTFFRALWSNLPLPRPRQATCGCI